MIDLNDILDTYDEIVAACEANTTIFFAKKNLKAYEMQRDFILKLKEEKTWSTYQ